MRKDNTICRTCFAIFSSVEASCRTCGSEKLTHHDEVLDLSIAHLDCDAFYAAIEKRDDPSLADKPIIIGGGTRSVVATCCYIARTYGVRSAMPMFKAREACPDAVIVKPNMEKYVDVSRKIRSIMNDLTPLVEPLSIDEAFLDMTGTTRVHHAPPAISLLKTQKKIEDEVGVTVSIGLSHNKFLAKMASDLDKPNGFSIIGRAETHDFLAGLPVTAIWGVGKAQAAKLHSAGISHVRQLQAMEQADLVKAYGELGLRLYRLSRGLDARSVKPERETKSLSSETTFNKDITDLKTLEDHLWDLSEKVSARLKKANLSGQVVTIKLKNSAFKSITRQRSIETPTNLARVIFPVAKKLLTETVDGSAYRLIGVGVSNIVDSANLSVNPAFFAEDTTSCRPKKRRLTLCRINLAGMP